MNCQRCRPECKTCLSLDSCISCNNGYILNGPSQGPMKCDYVLDPSITILNPLKPIIDLSTNSFVDTCAKDKGFYAGINSNGQRQCLLC